VSFIDIRGVRHTVDVTAESLYEAVILAVRVIRTSEWIESVGPAAPIEVEVRAPSLFIQRDHLAVDHRLVMQLGQTFQDGRIAVAEVVVISGAQVQPLAGLKGNRSVAIELQLVRKPRIVRERIRPQE
jgi:hypothetical protein